MIVRITPAVTVMTIKDLVFVRYVQDITNVLNVIQDLEWIKDSVLPVMIKIALAVIYKLDYA